MDISFASIVAINPAACESVLNNLTQMVNLVKVAAAGEWQLRCSLSAYSAPGEAPRYGRGAHRRAVIAGDLK
jgi:hypothetical protein